MGFRHDHDCLTASRALVVLSLWLVLDRASRARAGGPAAELPPAAPRAVDFVRDVQSLLARHCHACHGQNVQEGGLRPYRYQGRDFRLTDVYGNVIARLLA